MKDDTTAEPAADARTLDELIEQVEADGTKPPVAADAGTDDAEGGAEDAGEAAGDEAAEADEETDEASAEEKPPRRRPTGSERLKRRLAAAEAELSMLRRAPRDGAVTAEAIVAEIGPPPREQDFAGDVLAYERALTAYELDARQAVRELRKGVERVQHARLEAMRDAAEAHQERVEDFRRKVADFDRTLQGAQHLKASPVVEALVLESGQSAHLVYHLAKNPERLAKLNRMGEREAAREIGRLEARLSLPTPRTETRAPRPFAPPAGGAAPRSHESDLDGWLARTYGRRR